MSELNQLPIRTPLKWWKDDPINLTFTVKGVDWSGTHSATVINAQGTTVLTLTVSAEYSAPDTTFTFIATDTSTVAAGSYNWQCKKASGPTRFAGVVTVDTHPY